MKGNIDKQEKLFYTVRIDDRIPSNHPIRKIKKLADQSLKEINAELEKMYSHTGRPSIPPESLLKASLLIAFFSIRSDRLFCEMLDYNMLFRWFLDMDIEVKSFDHSVFSKNRERFIEYDISKKYFHSVIRQAKKENLLSTEHFTVDGSLIESWASLKSFKPKNEDEQKDPPQPRNQWNDYSGQKRSNDTHRSTTDPEALLMKKSKGAAAKLSFTANVLMENRNGLCVDVEIGKGNNSAERDAAKEMINRQKRKKLELKTLGGDKGYHTTDFIKFLRKKKIRPHIATKDNWRIAGLDKRTTRTAGYETSQVIRKRVEEIFGWFKTVGGMRKTRFIGITKNQQESYLICATYNLIRMAKLCPT